MVLGFSLADMMNHIDCFTGVEPALCPRDKSYLVMVYDSSNVLLNLICQYFVDEFCINVQQGYCFVVFSCHVFGFGISLEVFPSLQLPSLSNRRVEKIAINSSLNVYAETPFRYNQFKITGSVIIFHESHDILFGI